MAQDHQNLNAENSAQEEADGNVLKLNTGFGDDGDELRPDDPMKGEFEKAICLKGDKIRQLETDDKNPVLRSIAAIADSPDMYDAQISIYGYEHGFGPLYRVLDSIINLANQIHDTENETVFQAFKSLKGDADNEIGFRNIGRPKLPKVDDAYIAKMKIDPCRTLVDFYFSGADSAIRSKYNTVISWARENNKTGFVDWLSNDISYDDNGTLVSCGRGIKGALKFISKIKRPEPPAPKTKDDLIQLAKKIGHNSRIEVQSPAWVDKDMKDFMAFCSVEDGKLYVYDVTDSNKRSIEETIKLRHAQELATAYDESADDAEIVIENIQALCKLIGPGEFLIWQDNFQSYLLPLYPRWTRDVNATKIERCTHLHYAVLLQLGHIPEVGSDGYAAFPERFSSNFPYAFPDVFKFGYSTSEIKKIEKYKGDLNLKWTNANLYVFNSMGAQWDSTAVRRWKPGKSDSDGKMRYLSELPSGNEYLLMTATGSSNILSDDIDFDKARKEFKAWKDLRLSQDFKGDVDVSIVVENGVVAVWLPPVRQTKGLKKDDETKRYVYDGAFIKIGKSIHTDFRGKWCVAEKRIERIWNYISHPWEICFPVDLDELKIGFGEFAKETLSYDEALLVMKEFVDRTLIGDELLNDQEKQDKHFARLPNLCSDDEVGDEWVKEDGRYRHAAPEEPGKRLCIPLVLKCGRMWVHLPTVNT